MSGPGPCRRAVGFVALLLLTTVSCAGVTTGTAAGPVGTGGAGGSTEKSSEGSTTATRPSRLTGPSADATVMFSLVTAPGYYCPAVGTLNPTLVVYSDTAVLTADRIGAFCDPVPELRVGWTDPMAARALIEDLLAGPAGSVDMTDLPVTDMPYSTLTYTDGGSHSRQIGVYALGFNDSHFTMPAAQERARADVDRLLSSVTPGTAQTAEYRAPVLSVSWGSDGGPIPALTDDETDTLVWPLAMTAQSRALFSGSKKCLAVTGADVSAVLALEPDHTMSRFTAAGFAEPVPLVIGLVLPGWSPCAT